MVILQFIQCLGAIVLCALLVRMVARGRWVTWMHPVCAKCGFNLTGLPETSTRCPECGEDLAEVRRTGVRRRRWAALGISLVLIVLTLAVIVHEAIQPWVLVKLPTAVLLQLQPALFGKSFSWNPERQITAELNRRIINGQLSDAQMLHLAQIALSELSTAPFARDQERWIFFIHDRAKLPDPLWKKFAGMSMWVNILPKKNIARGGAISFELNAVEPRFDMKYRPHISIDGQAIDGPTTPDVVHLPANAMRWGVVSIEIPPKMLEKMPAGIHNVMVTVDTQALDTKTGAALASTKINYPYTINLLPRGETPVKQVPFASLPPEFLARWTAWRLFQIRSIYRATGKPQFVAFNFSARGLELHGDKNVSIYPVYQVIARSNGKETPLGVYFGTSPFWIPAEVKPQLSATTVDIILRPDPKSAAQSVEIGTILSDELVYKDVPMQ